jgi:hypothetical protein
MAGPSLKIRVGASLDSGALSVFEPLEKAAGKAAGNISKTLNKGAKSGAGALTRETKKEGDALDRELERMANKIIKDEEKAQRGRVREVERAAKERIKLEKEANREVERDLARHSREKAKAERESSREAQRQQRNNPSILDKAWWKAPRGQIGLGRRAAIGVSRATSIAYGLGGAAISAGLGAAENYASALGVDTSLAGHVQSAQALKGQAVSIANAGYIPGASGAAGQLQDSNEILKELQTVGDRTATSFADMGDGLRKFVGLTGDLETGRATIADLAKLAKATGANFGDMSEEAAEIANHMGDIPEKGPAILAVMRAVAGQGKLGAVETKDLARQMAKIAANAGKFEGGISKNISDLGVFAQEAKLEGGATSASQAATSVARFASGFATKSTLKHWTAAGINPYTDKSQTTLRSPMELVIAALKSTKGNLPALGQLFPSQQGIRPVAGFAAVYRRTGGTEEDKLRAVVAEFERLKSATLAQAEVDRAFGAVMETSQSKVQIANNKLDELAGHLENALLPAIAGLAPAIEAMTPAIVGMINKFAGILGIDVKGDEEKDNAAKGAAAVDAGRKELETATAGQGMYRPGFQMAPGTFNPAHLKAIEQQADKLNAQAAEEEGKKSEHPEDYSATTTTFDETGHREDIPNAEGAENAKKLQNIHEAANKTNQLLRDIHQAILEGRIALPEAPHASPAGREPGEADENSSHE